MFTAVKSVYQGFKKLLIVFLALGLIFILFQAFSTNGISKLDPEAANQRNKEAISRFINDEKLNSTQNGKGIITIYRSVTCVMVGEACFNTDSTARENADRSIVGFISNLLSFPTSNPPASGVYWAYSGLEQSGFIPKTYAYEGVGIAAIKGYQDIWKIFRDLAYVVLVLVIVIIGFLIMFRFKVNPQTVISLENSLPRIVITLVLITFSFAIAGFLIDLMYLLIALIISQLTRLNVPGFTSRDTVELISKYSSAQIADVFAPTDGIYKIGSSFLSVLPSYIKLVFSSIFTFIGSVYIAKNVNLWTEKLIKAAENIGGGAGGSALGFGAFVMAQIGGLPSILTFFGFAIIIGFIWPYIAGLILGLLIWFSVFFLVFRVFFLLLKIYLSILLNIIFAPIILLMHAIPGRNAFAKWFKSLAVNIAIFPLVILLILVANLISEINTTQTTWQPPFLYGMSTEGFTTLVALGMLLLIPDIVKAFKASVGIKESPIKFGLGTFFGGVTGVGGAGMEQIGKFGSLGLGLQHLQSGPLAKFIPFGKKQGSGH